LDVLKIEGRGKAADYVYTVTKCYRQAIDAYKEGTYTPEKVQSWLDQLEKVYNRGFWSGYYLGQKMGEWNDTHGSKATQKKIYLGKGQHFYSKLGVSSFKLEAHQLKVGDEYLVTGKTTGVIQGVVEELRVNDLSVEAAAKGEECSFVTHEMIRPSDKLYKIIPA